jgi:PH/SEC7 domain-containing protein
MNAFTPPVPAIPAEHKSLVSPLQTDSTTSHRPVDPRKPLPPIVQSPTTMRESEELDEKSIVFVDKAMPPLPPATPVRSAPALTITNKRRSMSVSDVDPVFQSTPIVVSPPTLKGAISRRNEVGPAQSADSPLPGLLDLFKGDLSTFEPFSGPSLDLSISNNRPVLGSHKTANKTESNFTISDPFGGMPNPAEGSTSSVFPPRTSSLKTPARNSVLGTPKLTTLRHATPSRSPSRSRTAPTNSAQTLTPRSANGMRHYSNASISEPSLIPSLGDGLPREFSCFI